MWQAARAHSIQALLKKAQNAKGFPSHPQVSSAVAVISAEKCRPCLGARARSFPHCSFHYSLSFLFFLKCHLPSCSSPMVSLRLTPKHQRSVIIAVRCGSVPAPWQGFWTPRWSKIDAWTCRRGQKDVNTLSEREKCDHMRMEVSKVICTGIQCVCFQSLNYLCPKHWCICKK